MLAINKAEYLKKYTINIEFNNGMGGIVDIEDIILKDARPIFNELKDLSKFKNFIVDNNTITWANGLDLAPEYLYFLAFKDNKSYQNQFKEWGYISA